jgi:hypothetical protein
MYIKELAEKIKDVQGYVRQHIVEIIVVPIIGNSTE